MAFQHVHDPRDLLDLLELKYWPNNQAHLFQLFNSLCTISLAPGESLKSYFYQIYSLVDKLYLHPQWRLRNSPVVCCILQGLPQEYNEAKHHLENTIDQYNLQAIMNYLLSKEMALGSGNTNQHGQQALFTKSPSQKQDKNRHCDWPQKGQPGPNPRASSVGSSNASKSPPSSSAKGWCKYHKSTTHNTIDCKEHLTQLRELQDMVSSKANIVEGSSDMLESEEGFMALSTLAHSTNISLEQK